MATWSDLAPWILAGIGWVLAAIGILLARSKARRAEKRATRSEEKLDSLLRVMAFEGKVINMGGGNDAKVVLLPSGKLGLN